MVSGTGCALADFLYTKVRFNSNVFQQYTSKKVGDGGLSPGKLVFVEELERYAGKSYPLILSDIINCSSFDAFNIGGPALVSLINASQLLPESEFDVNFYGCSGDDDVAGLIRSFLKKTPLGIQHFKTMNNLKTPFTDVLSDASYDNGQGERTFINNIGAARDYTPEMLDDSFFDSDIVCFGGTALVPQIHDHLTYLLIKSKDNGCLTVVNTVYDFRNEQLNTGKPWPLGTNNQESFKMIDMLIMDCEEALKISGQQTIDQAAFYFSQQSLASFIITNGSKNIYAYSNGTVFKAMELCQFPVSDAVVADLSQTSSDQRDTTGCGDNFAGGLIASLASQLKTSCLGEFDLREALSWGIASGGFACFYKGGTWKEQYRGQKLEQLRKYQDTYLKQIEGDES